MRLVGGDDVDALATGELGLEAARETAELVANGGFTTGRVQTGGSDAWMRVLVGIVPALDLIGLKEFHRVGKRVRYHVSLFRHSDGDALGIVDGRRITSLRTGSTAALAVAHALGGRPVTLGVVGSGEEAREGLRAVAAAVELEAARVYSPTAENRERFAHELGEELGVPIEPAAGVSEALDGADGAYVATAATSPVVAAADVAGLRMVAAVGATRPDHHELVGDVVASASRVVVDCADALEEPGDMIDATENFGWDAGDATLLGPWLATPAATDGGAPLLFKSIGSVEQDLVLARRLLLAAEAQGLGQVVEPVGSLRIMR